MAEQVSKIKKKQWYPIIAPKIFNSIQIGESLVYEPQALVGKTMSQSLMNLINDVKRQNISIHFKITSVDNNQAHTSIVGYEIIPSSIKRFVRRNTEKMDLSFVCETSDGVKLRVKPLIITRASVKGAIAVRMRKTTIYIVTKEIKKMTYDAFYNDIIFHKFQSSLRDILNKIYPLKVCEFRSVGIEVGEASAKDAEPVELPNDSAGESPESAEGKEAEKESEVSQ